MNTLEWRSRARVVAIVDLVLTVLQLVVVVMLVYGVGFLTEAVHDKDLGQLVKGNNQEGLAKAQEALKVAVWILWVMVAVMVVLSAIEMWAAVKLMMATELDNQFHKSLRQAQFWRAVTVVFLILNVIGGVLYGLYISTAITLIIRGVFLYVVQQFIGELENRLAISNQNLGAPMVTVMKN